MYRPATLWVAFIFLAQEWLFYLSRPKIMLGNQETIPPSDQLIHGTEYYQKMSTRLYNGTNPPN
eukprot:snap_masked-scaffold_27-processed-gene-2.42-mRNA-1 protein AED:1.00 eAED:1.00 QI:0/-1/0/0/-1/1/1/0/63